MSDTTRPADNGLSAGHSVATFDEVYRPVFAHTFSMRGLLTKIERVADTTATVLIRGESGVGKEVVAKAIHAASTRHHRPFIKVNCAALPSELLESELFGYEKGAFTGAYQRKAGKFDLAHGGTIFLDEIGDMPLALQAKLLHVLQDHEFVRVGGAETVSVDVRVIASTNRPLKAAVNDGDFRMDLYYRLKVIVLDVPPLRERPAEIPILAATFLRRFNAEFDRSVVLSRESLDALQRYSWPGNVREMENLIKSVVVLGEERLIHEELAGPAAGPPSAPAPAAGATREEIATAACPNLKEIAERASMSAQRDLLKTVLDRVHWNRAEAARVLGVSYKTLLYKLDRCGLARKHRKQRAS